VYTHDFTDTAQKQTQCGTRTLAGCRSKTQKTLLGTYKPVVTQKVRSLLTKQGHGTRWLSKLVSTNTQQHMMVKMHGNTAGSMQSRQDPTADCTPNTKNRKVPQQRKSEGRGRNAPVDNILGRVALVHAGSKRDLRARRSEAKVVHF